MTGNEIYKRVLGLLGYIENDIIIAGQETLFKRALDIINQICVDLKIPQIKRLSEKVEASEEALDALCYGTAMIMCLVEGDGAKNQIFTAIYNAKRATALSKTEIIADKLPFVR
ncbi:MAG: hypothetical protein E7537_04500 [Ruminococcaceae bacterium]|nr:hypothetical protein [Oscillospiraceae bacterium]